MAVDQDAVRELTLYIENCAEIVAPGNTIGQHTSRQLAKKWVKGTYNHEQAQIAWMHVVDLGARAYGWEIHEGKRLSARSWDGKGFERAPFPREFPADVRRAVAKGLADAWQAEVRDGEIDVKALAKSR